MLDLNEPTPRELEIASDFLDRYPGQLIYRISEKVLPISVSANWCAEAAHGEYLCIGSVDDRRAPDSIELLCRTLDAHQDVGFTYGDQIIVKNVDERQGRYYPTRDFDRALFRREYCMGSFFMFRISLLPIVGGFDEQFYSAGDFEYQVRLMLHTDGMKTSGIMGWFLDIGQGASSGGTHLSKQIGHVERNVIYLRYGSYDMVHIEYLREVKKYRIDMICYNGKMLPINKFLPKDGNSRLEQPDKISEIRTRYRKWLRAYYLRLPYRLLKKGVKIILIMTGVYSFRKSKGKASIS